MKVRTLRMKDQFKEFAIQEGPDLYTSEIPRLLNPEVTMERIKEYNKMFYPDLVFDYDKIEIVEFEMIEIGVIE